MGFKGRWPSKLAYSGYQFTIFRVQFLFTFFLFFTDNLITLFLFSQVFRSIDSGSLKGFPKNTYEAGAQVTYLLKDEHRADLWLYVIEPCVFPLSLIKKFVNHSLQNLVCAKNLVIDKSIQTAYIHAIRSAQHFIYIENQYFIGSSFAWPSYKEAGFGRILIFTHVTCCICLQFWLLIL